MKQVVREIYACIHASGESFNDYVREFSKVKDLALETNGTKPIEKAAFALHYLCCNLNDNQSMPALVVEGVLLYCKKNGYTWENNNLKIMYKKLKSAFDKNKAAEDIEGILIKYLDRVT